LLSPDCLKAFSVTMIVLASASQRRAAAINTRAD
jgi:hypothetical protein